jgi:hypothetical protein
MIRLARSVRTRSLSIKQDQPSCIDFGRKGNDKRERREESVDVIEFEEDKLVFRGIEHLSRPVSNPKQ